MTNEQLADWLDRLSSTRIYEAACLNALPDTERGIVPTYRHNGAPVPEGQRTDFVIGWEVSRALAMHRLGVDPGQGLSPAVRRHSACIHALRRAS